MNNVPDQNPECKLDLEINKRCKFKKKKKRKWRRECVCVCPSVCKNRMADFHLAPSLSRFLKISQ